MWPDRGIRASFGRNLKAAVYSRIAALFSCRSYSTPSFNQFPRKNVITRDVCIIGGGAAGTFSAIRNATEEGR